MDIEFLEKCLDDSFFMKEKTAEWVSALSCYIRADFGKVVSCHAFTDDKESCFVYIRVRYVKEDIDINVYAIQEGKLTDVDDFAYKVLKIWKDELEGTADLEEYAWAFAHKPELYKFGPDNEELRKIVFVNGGLLTDL